MTKAKHWVPEGYHTVTPYLIVSDAASAIEFYKTAFGAGELMRLPGPGGKVMHAEVKIGDSPVMLADEFPEMGMRSPSSMGGSPVSICPYVQDVDACFGQTIPAGAKEKRPLQDQLKFPNRKASSIGSPPPADPTPRSRHRRDCRCGRPTAQDSPAG